VSSTQLAASLADRASNDRGSDRARPLIWPGLRATVAARIMVLASIVWILWGLVPVPRSWQDLLVAPGNVTGYWVLDRSVDLLATGALYATLLFSVSSTREVVRTHFRAPPKTLAVALLAGAATAVLIPAATHLMLPVLQTVYPPDWLNSAAHTLYRNDVARLYRNGLSGFVLVLALAALTEELACRAVIQTCAQRVLRSAPYAIAYSTLIFVVAHRPVDVPRALSLALLSIALGSLFAAYRSLPAVVVAHLTHNLMTAFFLAKGMLRT